MFCVFTFSDAQKATSKSEATKEKKKEAKDVKEGKKKADADTKAKSNGLNKDGTPDMRLKTNKDLMEFEKVAILRRVTLN